MRNPDVDYGPCCTITQDEVRFWRELIQQYLKPLEENKEQQKKIGDELLELRNKTCLFFFLINGLFIILIFTLQMVSESTPNLSIHLPCPNPNFEGDQFEPISIAFMLVFGVLLLIQFLSMFVHRLSTFLHIASVTDIRQLCSGRRRSPQKKIAEDKLLRGEEAVQLVKDLQRYEEEEDVPVSDYINDPFLANEDAKWMKFKRRETRKQSRIDPSPMNFDERFVGNFSKLASDVQRSGGTLSDDTARSVRNFNKKSMKAISKMAMSNKKFTQSLVRKATLMQTKYKARNHRVRSDESESGEMARRAPAERLRDRHRRHRAEDSSTTIPEAGESPDGVVVGEKSIDTEL